MTSDDIDGLIRTFTELTSQDSSEEEHTHSSAENSSKFSFEKIPLSPTETSNYKIGKNNSEYLKWIDKEVGLRGEVTVLFSKRKLYKRRIERNLENFVFAQISLTFPRWAKNRKKCDIFKKTFSGFLETGFLEK